MDVIAPPQCEKELMQRAHALSGVRLGDLAERLGVPIPPNLLRDKGWAGQLLEQALGADAGSKQLPDFQQLGIELKSLPITKQGKPRETTYVCTVPLVYDREVTWTQSWVRRKLAKVLWVPLDGSRGVLPAERRIGLPFLWQPSAEQEAILQQDWEELMEMVAMGRLEEVSARHGTYLQIRPKAANSRSLAVGLSEAGEQIFTLPRGFYLRTTLTQQLLSEAYGRL